MKTVSEPVTTYPDQQRLLEQIASMLPPNISLVNELADLLDISTDSAYRRIRGETELSFSETVTLCNRFHITFDSLVESDVNVVNFVYHDYKESLESFTSYFEGLCQELEQIRYAGVETKHMTFIGPGVPVLHFFHAPMLGPFKIFYWIKSMNLPDASFKSFNRDVMDSEIIELGKKVFEHYMHIPSTEIWTDSSVLGVIHQIRFCWDTGLFRSQEDALQICQEFRELLESIELEAEQGQKFVQRENGKEQGAAYHMYYSELEDENTCVHVQVGEQHAVYLGHLNHRYIKTTNESYAHTTQKWYEQLKKKSLLISASSASTRYQFFKRGHDHLKGVERHIKGAH